MMNYDFFKNIDKFEVIDFFITGIDIGIISKDDFYDYVLRQIEENDKPDPMYCEIALILSKNWKALRTYLLEILRNYGYVIFDPDIRTSKAYYLCILGIEDKYKNKEIYLKEVTELFYKVAVIYDPYSEVATLDDMFVLSDSFDPTLTVMYEPDDSNIEERVEDIFKEAKKELKSFKKFQ